jgi:hypothetical protein
VKKLFPFLIVAVVGLLLYLWYQKQLGNAYNGGIEAGQKEILGF